MTIGTGVFKLAAKISLVSWLDRAYPELAEGLTPWFERLTTSGNRDTAHPELVEGWRSEEKEVGMSTKGTLVLTPNPPKDGLGDSP